MAKFAEEYHCKGLLLSNATEALKDERVDAVVISVNSPAHFEGCCLSYFPSNLLFSKKLAFLIIISYHDGCGCWQGGILREAVGPLIR